MKPRKEPDFTALTLPRKSTASRLKNIGIYVSLAVLLIYFNFVPFSASVRPLKTWKTASSLPVQLPDLYEASIPQLQAGLDAGHFTSVDLVKAYLARIDEVNVKGPQLRAVIETNAFAIEQAAALDEERKVTGKRSNLHGIPVLLKDNIATVSSEGMNTTAGSYALEGSVVADDAGVVKRLRQAGAIILGKANLSEWSHSRGNMPAGWSGRGGQNTNAYYPGGDACGSSSGSGVAASIGLAAATLGTETDGSITCPSNRNNIVGIKPTLGLTSRAGVIPISAHQDTVGPMARSVTDAAIVLNMIAGKDPKDNYTMTQPDQLPDFTRGLRKNGLNGKRLGVPRKVFLDEKVNENDPYINILFSRSLQTLKSLGAVIVDPADFPSADDMVRFRANETFVLRVDLKIQLNEWFSQLLSNPTGVTSLAELIAFNNAHPELEKPANYTSQSGLIGSEATSGYNSTYFDALATNVNIGATNGIDFVLRKYKLDAIVLPAPGWTTKPAAMAGYPIVTVPLGFFPENVTIKSTGPSTVYPAPGMPIGLSFIGTAFSEFDLISFAYAYEQTTQTRLERLAYPAAVPSTQLKDVMSA